MRHAVDTHRPQIASIANFDRVVANPAYLLEENHRSIQPNLRVKLGEIGHERRAAIARPLIDKLIDTRIAIVWLRETETPQRFELR